MNLFRFQRAVRASSLEPRERLVLLILSTYYGKNGSIHPSLGTLAEGCGLSARYVRQIMGRLEVKGWIEKEARRGLTNVYHLRNPSPQEEQTPEPYIRGGRNYGSSPPRNHGSPPPGTMDHPPPELYIRGGRNYGSPEGHIQEPIQELSEGKGDEESPAVSSFRRRVAKRWGVSLLAPGSIVEGWLSGMEAHEVTAVLDDCQRRIDYATSKGSPMRLARRQRLVCEVLEVHAETRPNRETLPRLVYDAEQTTEQPNPKAQALIEQFMEGRRR